MIDLIRSAQIEIQLPPNRRHMPRHTCTHARDARVSSCAARRRGGSTGCTAVPTASTGGTRLYTHAVEEVRWCDSRLVSTPCDDLSAVALNWARPGYRIY